MIVHEQECWCLRRYVCLLVGLYVCDFGVKYISACLLFFCEYIFSAFLSACPDVTSCCGRFLHSEKTVKIYEITIHRASQYVSPTGADIRVCVMRVCV